MEENGWKKLFRKLGRDMKYFERVSDPTAKFNSLAKPAAMMLGILETSVRLAPTPVLSEQPATTGEYVCNPELNTRSLYAIESDGEENPCL